MKAIINSAQSERLRQGAAELGLSLSDDGIRAIEQHIALVLKWRDKINLVSVRDPMQLISHHVLDSLALMPLLNDSKQVLDFGTGAGFPGLPLAAAMPATQFTLLDSRLRRIEFLRMVVNQAQMQNVQLISSRVQDCPSVDFDTLVVRAVASLSDLFHMTAHLHNKGLRLIAMKGQLLEAEISGFKQQAVQHNVSIHAEPLFVPFLKAQRHAIVIQF